MFGLIIAVAALFLIQIWIFIFWLAGKLDFSVFFKNKSQSSFFFIPVLGLFAFLFGVVRARLYEDFNK